MADARTRGRADERGPERTHERTHERLAHDERRGSILTAVRELCQEEGMAGLSISAITKRVGCTRSLFYHYFPSKEAALDAALDDSIDRMIDRLRAWDAQRERGNIEGALDSVAALLISIVRSEEGLARGLSDGEGAAGSAVPGTSAAVSYTDYIHRVVDRAVRYICDSTVVDFAAHHEVKIDHIYETFYVLVSGLVMYLRTHPGADEALVKEIIASTLHIEGYTAKYRDRA